VVAKMVLFDTDFSASLNPYLLRNRKCYCVWFLSNSFKDCKGFIRNLMSWFCLVV